MKFQKIFKFIFLTILAYETFNQLVFADEVGTGCNINAECQFGFVCISGNAQNIDPNTGVTSATASFCPFNGSITRNSFNGFCGRCVATVPLRAACYVYNIFTGKFGRAIVIVVLFSAGAMALTNKLDMKQILSLFIGIVLVFGSFQLISFLMGSNVNVGYCNLIDYSQPVGMPDQGFISASLANQ